MQCQCLGMEYATETIRGARQHQSTVCADMNSERPMRLPYVKVEAGIKREVYGSH